MILLEILTANQMTYNSVFTGLITNLVIFELHPAAAASVQYSEERQSDS